MLGPAPRRVRLEYVVLEKKVLRVGPVIGDLARVVIAHHIDEPAIVHDPQQRQIYLSYFP